jgi:hypothetical protein
MPVVSGKNGNVKWDSVDIPDARRWRASLTANVKPYASSDTGGGMSRVAGQKDSTVSVECYNNTTTQIQTLVREGDEGTLDCYTDGTLYWSMEAICETVELGAEIESGDPNAATLTFGQMSNITPPA